MNQSNVENNSPAPVLSCDVFADLLPLYHDNICSPSSRKLVDQHLQICDGCRSRLENLNRAISLPPVSQEEAPLRGLAQKWNRKKKKMFLKGAVLAVIIFVLLIALYVGLFQRAVQPLDSKLLKMEQAWQFDNGCIAVEFEIGGNYEVADIINRTTADGSLYLTPSYPIIKTPKNNSAPSPYKLLLTEQNPDITAIYLGSPDDAILIWQKGMELPPATPEIEKLYSIRVDSPES